MNKVISLDMILEGGTQPNTGSIFSPKSLPFLLSCSDFPPFATPEVFDVFMIESPAIPAKDGRDLAILKATILTGQFDHSSNQTWLMRYMPLAMLSGT
jgi:hypothetical protein